MKSTLKWWIIIVAVVLLLFCAIAVAESSGTCEDNLSVEDAVQMNTIVPAINSTCAENGHTFYEDIIDGTVVDIQDDVPAKGHRFGLWEDDPNSNGLVRICTVCGFQEHKQKDTLSLPRIDLVGDIDGISKSERVLLSFDFFSSDESFSCFAYTSYQGHTTLHLEKHNYTVRLFDDAELTEKHRISFRNWQREHKYILKANYLDPSQARNLVSAGIWADMAVSRAGLSERLRTTSNYGAVDGFPVTVWLNGEFLGLYTMNLHKDDDLYGMEKGAAEAVVIANAQTKDESLFRSRASFDPDEGDWEMEFCGTGENDQWAEDSFNDLIDFVMASDDKTFREGLAEYLDVDAAVDYLIYLYALGLTDNSARDLVMLKYEGEPWIPSAYDMEDAFGLSPDGTSYLSPSCFLPRQSEGKWISGTNSLLWDRVLQCFFPEIQTRYTQLRKGILSEDALIRRIDTYMDAIPTRYYEDDLALYPNRPIPQGDPRIQMENYIRERFPLLDEALLNN